MEQQKPGSHILPERMDRFTWHDGDLIFFETTDEFIDYTDKPNRSLIEYDFPDLQLETKIKSQPEEAKINWREINRTTAKETRKVIKQGFYEKDGKKINLIGEKFYSAIAISPAESEDLVKKVSIPDDGISAKISVVDVDTFEACRHGDEKFLAMNFANAKHPGGGFLSGANAQEEALCRESTLFDSLSSVEAQKMYDYNQTHNKHLYSDYMIISPNVCIFRDIKDQFLDVPALTSVITVPAPNRNGAAQRVPQEMIDTAMKSRLKKMFAVSSYYGYKHLVLGAWGCGAFGNDPRTVAEYFRELLFDEGYRYLFDTIIFAIFDRGEKVNFNVFREVFS